MAAKKTATKTVTIEIDVEALLALLEAAERLADIVAIKATHSDDPALRRLVKKGAKKGAKKGSKKRR